MASFARAIVVKIPVFDWWSEEFKNKILKLHLKGYEEVRPRFFLLDNLIPVVGELASQSKVNVATTSSFAEQALPLPCTSPDVVVKPRLPTAEP